MKFLPILVATLATGLIAGCVTNTKDGGKPLKQEDPEVQASLTGGGRERPGFSRLKEAAAVAFLFELTLGAGTPLPAEFKEFLKHHGGN